MSINLDNFSQFAGQFTKIIIPVVETAMKMSAQEPVSAYEVFNAAQDLASSNKTSKKKQNGSTKNKNSNKGKIKKVACAPASTKSVKSKSKMSRQGNTLGSKSQVKNTHSKYSSHKKQTTKLKKATKNVFTGSEVVNLVEKLYTDGDKKLSKDDQKKKKNLEEYLAKQLETDDVAELEEDNESSYSEDSEFEDAYTDSNSNSGQYSINCCDTFSESESNEEEMEKEFSSTNEDDAAEALVQAKNSKSNKKRKSPDLVADNTKASSNLSNMETKKSKSSEDSKSTLRKSLPSNKNANVVDDSKKRRTLASLGDIKKKSKASTSIVSFSANVKLEPLSSPENIVKLNSIEEGKRAFKWLLNPVTVDDFFNKYWEQKACLIKREQNDYFGQLISFESIDQMLLKNHVEFTKNIDVTSYKNGVRETLNPEGRALPPVVWDHYDQGCSIRLLNPQTFLPELYTLSATMQEYFHCLVGANAYLTPPNSQGFAPHYDDIEAFVLQIEGRKRWKLYKPRSTAEILPRYSSQNFSQQEIGKPVFDEVLEPGSVLYFPRGTIHQASTEPGYHSLHITLSVYQKQSFADLFEKMLPLMLQKAIASNVDLRRGLPLHAWQHAGIAYSDNSTKERADLTKKVAQLMHKCIRDMPLQDIMDAGVDQLAKKFQHEALPPEVLPAEKLRTVFGSRSRTNEHGECVCDYDIDERTNVRLLRANILRLVDEEQKIRIYYYLDNSKEYCGYEPNFIEIESIEAASVEVLIKSYPQYVGVSQLPLPSNEKKINLVTALWERGLLMMEKAFR